MAAIGTVRGCKPARASRGVSIDGARPCFPSASFTVDDPALPCASAFASETLAALDAVELHGVLEALLGLLNSG